MGGDGYSRPFAWQRATDHGDQDDYVGDSLRSWNRPFVDDSLSPQSAVFFCGTWLLELAIARSRASAPPVSGKKLPSVLPVRQAREVAFRARAIESWQRYRAWRSVGIHFRRWQEGLLRGAQQCEEQPRDVLQEWIDRSKHVGAV